MKKLNKKGFTLIELLAVITMIAILMLLAIPSVSSIIENSRSDTFVTNAKTYANAAKKLWTSDSLYCGSEPKLSSAVVDGDYYILIDTADETIFPLLESGGRSPWGNRDVKGYVRISKSDDGKKTKYYVALTDGIHAIYDDIFNPIQSDQLVRKDVVRDITSETKKLKKIQETPFETGKYTTCSEESLTWTGTSDPYIEEYEPKTDGVAYALFSEADNSLTFVRSNSVIKAGDIFDDINVTNVYKGFETNDATSSGSGFVPWGDKQNVITKVVFKDVIKPISTAWWFSDMSKCTYYDLKNLDTSNVGSMRGMFYRVGGDGLPLVLDLSTFDVSNVTNIRDFLTGAGYRSSIVSIDFTGWNIEKITSFDSFFFSVGHYAQSVTFIGLETWDTSNVNNMEWMFIQCATDCPVFNIGDISVWDTSNVTNMEGMFQKTGQSASYSLDLRGWNVDKVTSHSMFNYNVSYKVKAPIWKN